MDHRLFSVFVLAFVFACSSAADTTVRRPGGTGAVSGSVSPGGGSAASSGSFGSPVPRAGSAATGPWSVAGSGASAGAGNIVPIETGCGGFTQSSEVKKGEADIVWVIDGSLSMLDELAAVQQNITTFANSIGAAGIDHHVVMLAATDVAGPTPLGMDPAHYQFVFADVNSDNSLRVLINSYPQYSAFLRPNATLHVVVVSDDESSMPAAEFQTQMTQLANKPFTFHAIASENLNGLPCAGACGIPFACGGTRPGDQYYALANATGGQKVSICVTDWSMVFGPLEQAVIASAPLPCDYAIPASPSGETFDPDEVNVDFTSAAATKTAFPRADSTDKCGSELAWHYDDPSAPQKIQMCPSACEAIKAGGTISIQLGCATVVLF